MTLIMIPMGVWPLGLRTWGAGLPESAGADGSCRGQEILPCSSPGRTTQGMAGQAPSRTSPGLFRGGNRPVLLLLALIPLLFFGFGCSCRLDVPVASGQFRTVEPMSLYDHPLLLHLSRPAQAPADSVLLVYATGDGGWSGLAGDIYDWLAQWNYPVVGFSSKEYLKNLGYVSDTTTTTPRRLVRDYQSIIGFAESRLELPASTPVILVGLSRGAGLSVVAAGQGDLGSHLAGLLAIALTKEEEHVFRYRSRALRSDGDAPRRERVMIETYRYLNRFASLPVMVLQSTHDGYLPADEARRLFGPDTAFRKLRAVEAANHSFRRGCHALYAECENALKWITGLLASTRPN